MDKLKSLTIVDNEIFLRQISKPVFFLDKDLKNDIKILEQFCKENKAMAMAAVQLGIPKRIVYLKNTNLEIINKMQNDSETEEERNYNESRVLINPVIILREGLTDYWEACASCLDYMGHVKRPYKITLEYYDEYGKFYKGVFEGFEATVLSHELDHLDGILHMDVADEVTIMSREERKKFRQTHGYNIVSKDGDYEELLNSHKVLKKFK